MIFYAFKHLLGPEGGVENILSLEKFRENALKSSREKPHYIRVFWKRRFQGKCYI